MVATTGVLFKNAARGAIGKKKRNNAIRSVLGLPSNLFTNKSMPPALEIPAATTNIAATVIKPELLKPANASLAVKMPDTLSTVRIVIITTWGAKRENISVGLTHYYL